MFEFNYAEGATIFTALGIWFIVFASLFLFNEFGRRKKWVGFLALLFYPLF